MVASSEYRVNIVISSKDQTSQAASTASKGMVDLSKAAKLAAAAFVAFKVAQQGIEFAKFGAEVQRASNSVNNLAASFGSSGDEIIASMQEASDYTIDRMTAMSAANKAMLLGVADSPEAFGELADIATKLGRAMGQDAAKSIDDFVVAAGRQSKMIADNLGLTVSAEDAYQRYAAQLGKTSDQLSDTEKKQAFLNEMLRQGRENVKRLDDGTTDLATRFEQLSAAAKDAKAAVGETLAVELAETADALEAVGLELPQTRTLLEEVTKATLNNFFGLDQLQVGLKAWAEQQRENNTQIAISDAQLAQSSAIYEQYTQAIAQSSDTTSRYSEAVTSYTSISYLAADATLAHVESQDSLQYRVLESIAAQEAEAEALAALTASTNEAAISQNNLAISLKDATDAQIAQAALSDLGEMLKEDKITLEQYNTAANEVMLTFGLATPESIALTEKLSMLNTYLADGKIDAENYADALTVFSSQGTAAKDTVIEFANSISNIPSYKRVTIEAVMTSSGGGGGGGAGASSSTTTNNYNMTVNTQAATPSIVQDFDVMRQLVQ